MRVLLSILGIIAIMTVSQSCKNSKTSSENKSNIHTVIVKEAIQAGEYTYLKVTEDDAEKWLAAPACVPIVGATYYYKGGTEMKNFQSKQLNKTFESVYFIDNLSSVPITDETTTTTAVTDTTGANAMSQHIAKTTTEKIDVKIAPVSGGITIAELYKNKASYAGKTVKVKGKVTKFSSAIMDKNWIHLQDGTEFDKNFDLAITTLGEVAAGDTIIATGKIALDKDFGYNYTYKVIMEDATVKTK
jgi:hypothetical protein